MSSFNLWLAGRIGVKGERGNDLPGHTFRLERARSTPCLKYQPIISGTHPIVRGKAVREGKRTWFVGLKLRAQKL